jgi:hypothetical protein
MGKNNGSTHTYLHGKLSSFFFADTTILSFRVRTVWRLFVLALFCPMESTRDIIAHRFHGKKQWQHSYISPRKTQLLFW